MRIDLSCTVRRIFTARSNSSLWKRDARKSIWTGSADCFQRVRRALPIVFAFTPIGTQALWSMSCSATKAILKTFSGRKAAVLFPLYIHHAETGDIFVLHRNLRFYLLCVSGLPWRSPSFLTLGWPEIEVKSPAIFNTSYFIS